MKVKKIKEILLLKGDSWNRKMDCYDSTQGLESRKGGDLDSTRLTRGSGFISSLRGARSISECNKAIQKNNVDCHEFANANSRNDGMCEICARDKRAGFTMIEIVFVIVITGLVAAAGGKAIVQILHNYVLQKEFAKIEMDSASAIRQISNYLQNSIWDSIALSVGGQFISMPYVNCADKDKAPNCNYEGRIGKTNMGTFHLYFIEKDTNITNGYPSAGNNYPYFSGFVDVNLSSGTTIVSQSGSDKLTDLNATNLALYFPFVNVGTNAAVGDKYYQNDKTKNTAIFSIKSFHDNYTYRNTAGQNINTGRDSMELHSAPKQIGDVATIVSLVPTIIGLEDGTNTNYEKGDLIITRGADTTILAKKVSNLHIWTESSSSLIRIRICFEAGVTKSIVDEFCKEGIIMQ